jgi:hypothetical protein
VWSTLKAAWAKPLKKVSSVDLLSSTRLLQGKKTGIRSRLWTPASITVIRKALLKL